MTLKSPTYQARYRRYSRYAGTLPMVGWWATLLNGIAWVGSAQELLRATLVGVLLS
jgi:hypothetical protein